MKRIVHIIKCIVENIYFFILRNMLKLKVRLAKYEYGLNTEKRDIPIVLSFTSFPARFPYMELCIKSLLIQKVKPDHIILWLGSDAADVDIDKYFGKYYRYGLEVRIDKNANYMSHKKYVYAMKEFADCLIVLADDDLIYPSDMIKTLYETYKEHPDNIIARRVHTMKSGVDGHFTPYLTWWGYNRKKIIHPSFRWLATTGAGSLFPPGSLFADCLDMNKALSLSGSADDIWLKFMATLKGIKVVWAKNRMPMPATISGSQTEKLENVNVKGNMNDVYIRKLLDYYGMSEKDFGL